MIADRDDAVEGEEAEQACDEGLPCRELGRGRGTIRVGLAGHENEMGSEPEPVAADRIDIPQEFVRRVFDVVTLGTTVLVTDEAITSQTTGPHLSVVNSDPPES